MLECLISCIIPAYNAARYLADTLDSVLAQTYKPVEIIVVDDGSTDGTGAVAVSYETRVRYLFRENTGEAAARNCGLAAAQGEFVAFIDADDLWQPEKLSRQIVRFSERPEIDLCFTRFQNFWIPELADEERRYQGSPLALPQSAWSTSTLLARRSVFSKFGNFPDDSAQTPGSESMIWFLHAVEAGAVVEVLPDILTHRRMHATNVSRKNPVQIFFPILKEWRDYQRRRHNG
jgi:glycosyltransferase involved in cell wall biosynthesis